MNHQLRFPRTQGENVCSSNELFSGVLPRSFRPFNLIAASLCLTSVSAEQPLTAHGNIQLNLGVQPIAQTVTLSLDPAKNGYTGSTDIRLQITKPTNSITLDALELPVQRATIDGSEVALSKSKDGGLVATFSEVMPVGMHHLHMAFTNLFRSDFTGIYKVEDGNEPYLLTHLFPASARSAFPCWDGPAFKIPWVLKVEAPNGLSVFSNMPIMGSSPSGTNIVYEFEPTPPMTAQLLAIAVGRFATIEVPNLKVPGRVVVRPGKETDAQILASETAGIVQSLEDYFGFPYPLPKLDQFVINEPPYGSMENPGLVMYNGANVFVNPTTGTAAQRHGLYSEVAHELTHVFGPGNVVTMESWRAFWFHEGFASFLGNKIADQRHPEVRDELEGYFFRAEAHKADSADEVGALTDIADADSAALNILVYEKGEAILRMLETYYGPETFRDATRSFVRQHRWGTVDSSTLFQSFDQSHPSLGGTLKTFAEQPGIPQIQFTRLSGNTCEVRQVRYSSSSQGTPAPECWQIPIILRYGIGGETREAKFLVNDRIQTFSVPDLDRASWIMPNGGASGYYLWSLSPELSSKLLAHTDALSPLERADMLDSAYYSLLAGNMTAESWLSLLLKFAGETSPQLQQKVVDALSDVGSIYLRGEQNGNYSCLLREKLWPMLCKVGLESNKSDSEIIDRLRASLIRTLGMSGHHQGVIDFCKNRAELELRSHQVSSSQTGFAILEVASYWGNAEWFEALKVAAGHVGDAPMVRERYMRALGQFRDATIIKRSLDFGVSKAATSSDLFTILLSVADRSERTGTLLPWVNEHFSELLGLMPDTSDEHLRELFPESKRNSTVLNANFSFVESRLAVRDLLRKRHMSEVMGFIDALHFEK